MQSFVFTFPDTEILIGGWKILESRNSKKDLACAKKIRQYSIESLASGNYESKLFTSNPFLIIFAA